jgi:hypothetical protein
MLDLSGCHYVVCATSDPLCQIEGTTTFFYYKSVHGETRCIAMSLAFYSDNPSNAIFLFEQKELIWIWYLFAASILANYITIGDLVHFLLEELN